ncbi:MAG: type I DNA topoisomerase [Deltaproteobacteria bacterium]|nr:type I DNA topoisomerase [Deltaproteobacteria bacterium]
MKKDLIIVESPAKIKTIKKILGSGFEVEASVGHVRDLPAKVLGVDEDRDFLPMYEVIPGKTKVVAKLKKAAANADTVYLAPDPDREGEAIAWHVAELIRNENPNLKRIQFNEITPRAIREALDHPGELRESVFSSQQARRILDRLVGYKLSPLLWSKVKRGISAGRVQSVALRLIVDRERERQAFTPEEYWVFKAHLDTELKERIIVDLWKVNGKKPNISSAQQAQELQLDIRNSAFAVASVEEKERRRQPRPPFITSTLQQEASSRLGYPAKKTMGVAQKLYEGVELGSRGTTALITYMRTDSVRVADDARQAAAQWIDETLGKDYLPAKPRTYKSKGSAQDAHEAIRPVDPNLTPDEVHALLPADQYRLYRLIWERFMASQMADARFWDTTVTVEAGRTAWRVKGERLIFPGFMAVLSGSDGQERSIELPALAAGQSLALADVDAQQKFTQPPPKYSEASLVKKLEEEGIGRPSTYAAIISTLQDREYVVIVDRHFNPTDLGMVVSDLLVAHFSRLMDTGFTARMEEDLDNVAVGKVDWVDLLKSFAREFDPTLSKAMKEMDSVKGGIGTELSCPLCGSDLVIKFGKNGNFLACTKYPDCGFTSNYSRDEDGNLVIEKPRPQEREVVGTCPECGRELHLKRSRTGSRFIGCSGYPDCRHTEPLTTGVACPREGCAGTLVEKSSRRGKIFYSCDQYPKCDYALWDMPVQGTCPECGSPLLVQKKSKTGETHIACPVRGCSYRREED